MNSLKKLSAIMSAALLLLAFINILPAGSKADAKPGKTAHVPDVLILKVRAGITLEDNPGGGVDHKYSTNSTALDETLSSFGIQSVKSVFPRGQGKVEDGLSRVYRLKLKPNTDVKAAVAALSAVTDVAYAEPDYIAVRASNKLITIDDPLYPEQWGVAKINIVGAWDDTYGTPTVTIAIIDSGIDLTHVDLANHLWVNPGEVVGNSLDDDNNGYIDDVQGWNFVAASNDLWDDNGHGTLTTGVAAAIGGNTAGIVGVCPECTIMPVKVMQPSGVSNYSDVAAGVLYAAQKGAKVINLSLGGYANSNTLRNAIDTAVNTYGVVVVAGAGNDNLSTPFYPAAYPNVLAVAGTAADDTKMGFSNYGSWVDVSAPAVDIRTTALGGDWANGSGTSVASPFAAGLAGLLRTLHPEWNQATIRSQIVHTTDSIESLNPTYAGQLGTGRLNAGAAMMDPHPILAMTGYSVNGTANGRPVLGVSANLVVTLNNDWWNAAGVTGTLSTADTYVTITNGTAVFGDIAAAASGTNAAPFTFTVAPEALYNHPIDFTLDVSDTTGYTNTFNFTVMTESGIQNVAGTIGADTTWTNDKTYLITNNVYVAPGFTLTIQPGTTIKFNGNYVFGVYGTLIADGTAGQPIHFISNTTGVTWNNIQFYDSSVDAIADGTGVYTSGSILRYVTIDGTTGGIDCTTSTPYLAHINLSGGGIVCSLGATPVWFMDNTIAGGASFTGAGNAYRNTVSGNLSISGAGALEDNTVNGSLFLGSGNARRNSTSGGGLTVGGTGGTIQNNSVSGGDISAGTSFQVLNNTVGGSLSAGNGSTVDHNTAWSGISVGNSAIVTWNNVEGASGTGLNAGASVTARYNRLIGNAAGMTATTGTIEHNLIANNTGVGLQVGAATVQYNTFTGNQGNTILVEGGNPVTIGYNNLEGNTGTFDVYLNIPIGVYVFTQHNWWGTTDNLIIAERIYDWADDPTKATASYTLKLIEPDQTAPAYVRNITVLPDTTLGIQTGVFAVEFSRPMDNNYTPEVEFLHYILGQDSNPKFFQISTAVYHACGLKMDGSLVCWGRNLYGETTVPAGYYIQVSTGVGYGCALDYHGSLHCWGAGHDGQLNVPGSNYTQVSAGYWHACGLKNDSSIVCWGLNNSGQTNAPTGSFTQVSGGGYHSCGLKSDGSIVCWGNNSSGQTTVPSGSYIQVSAGDMYTCGLKTDHSIVCWGDNTYGRAEAPTGNFTYVSTSNSHACGLKSDGSLMCWGLNDYDQTVVPSGDFMQVSVGERYTCVLKKDGTPYCWGINDYGQIKYPVRYSITDNAYWSSTLGYQATYDITSALLKDTYRLSVNVALDPDGMRIVPFSNVTFNVDYAGFISDKTPPLQPTVTANGDGSLTTLSASWTSSDPESLITKYRYAIGTTPGARDVVEWTYTNDTSMTRTGLTLTPGITYYVSAGARNEGGLWSETGISIGIVAGVTPPGAFGKSTPANNSIKQPFNPVLSWSASIDVTEYLYCLDKETVNNDTCDSAWISAGTSTSLPLSGLSAYSTYYWQVRAVNTGGSVPADSGVWWKFTTAPITASFTSVGASDGWILETSETSLQGGALNATETTFRLGDEAGDRQYRAILSFNTTSLPENAVITKVTLKIRKMGQVGSNPFTLLTGLKVDIRKPFFGTTVGLVASDFQAGVGKAGVGTFGKVPVNNWYSAVINSLGYAHINKAGTTQFRLYFVKDDNDNNLADYLKFFSGNYGTVSARPTLIIQYYIP